MSEHTETIALLQPLKYAPVPATDVGIAVLAAWIDADQAPYSLTFTISSPGHFRYAGAKDGNTDEYPFSPSSWKFLSYAEFEVGMTYNFICVPKSAGSTKGVMPIAGVAVRKFETRQEAHHWSISLFNKSPEDYLSYALAPTFQKLQEVIPEVQEVQGERTICTITENTRVYEDAEGVLVTETTRVTKYIKPTKKEQQ